MVVDEQYMKIRRSLEEKLGVEEASYLMDRPPGGWSELVTNRTLDLKFEGLVSPSMRRSGSAPVLWTVSSGTVAPPRFSDTRSTPSRSASGPVRYGGALGDGEKTG